RLHAQTLIDAPVLTKPVVAAAVRSADEVLDHAASLLNASTAGVCRIAVAECRGPFRVLVEVLYANRPRATHRHPVEHEVVRGQHAVVVAVGPTVDGSVLSRALR